MNLQMQSEYQKQVTTVETEIKVAEYMLIEVKNSKESGTLPSNIVSSSQSSNNYINQYNELVLKRKKIAQRGTDANPTIQNIDNQLNSLKLNITESLKSRINDLVISKRDLVNQRGIYQGKIGQVPTHDKKINSIARQQNIKESLFLYLLQKREETQISLAVTSPKAKIIDNAYLSGPVSLSKNIFYLVALVLGLLIPFTIIFLIHLFDTKVKNRHDIESKISVPFLGDLPRSENNEVIKSNSRSSASEAIRMIRTNLDFMLAHVPENKCKTIFVTSSIPKEGKTFFAVNLATTIAFSGKKVLIIGLDIRNPKMDKYIDIPSRGVTNFLSKSNESIHDYIVPVKDFTNFFALPSGIVPPNPVELLMNFKINDMFETLKKYYDYIIVDTAPVNVVTDTILIALDRMCWINVC